MWSELTSNSWHLEPPTPETEALFGSLPPSVWAKSEIMNGPRFGWQCVSFSARCSQQASVPWKDHISELTYYVIIWVKWTNHASNIDVSNYETMSAANEDRYVLAQPQPMYWEVSVWVYGGKLSLASDWNFDHCHDSAVFRPRSWDWRSLRWFWAPWGCSLSSATHIIGETVTE